MPRKRSDPFILDRFNHKHRSYYFQYRDDYKKEVRRYQSRAWYPVDIGDTIGRYVVEAFLGSGAHGTVWLVTPTGHPDHYLALKVNEVHYKTSDAKEECERVEGLQKLGIDVVGCSDINRVVYVSGSSKEHPYHICAPMEVAGLDIYNYIEYLWSCKGSERETRMLLARKWTQFVKTCHEQKVFLPDMSPNNFTVSFERIDKTYFCTKGSQINYLDSKGKVVDGSALRSVPNLPRKLCNDDDVPTSRLGRLVNKETFLVRAIDVSPHNDVLPDATYRSPDVLARTLSTASEKANIWTLCIGLIQVLAGNIPWNGNKEYMIKHLKEWASAEERQQKRKMEKLLMTNFDKQHGNSLLTDLFRDAFIHKIKSAAVLLDRLDSISIEIFGSAPPTGPSPPPTRPSPPPTRPSPPRADRNGFQGERGDSRRKPAAPAITPTPGFSASTFKVGGNTKDIEIRDANPSSRHKNQRFSTHRRTTSGIEPSNTRHTSSRASLHKNTPSSVRSDPRLLAAVEAPMSQRTYNFPRTPQHGQSSKANSSSIRDDPKSSSATGYPPSTSRAQYYPPARQSHVPTPSARAGRSSRGRKEHRTDSSRPGSYYQRGMSTTFDYY